METVRKCEEASQWNCSVPDQADGDAVIGYADPSRRRQRRTSVAAIKRVSAMPRRPVACAPESWELGEETAVGLRAQRRVDRTRGRQAVRTAVLLENSGHDTPLWSDWGNLPSEDLAVRPSGSWDTGAGVSFGCAWTAARAPESH
ncbi:MAG: hypothetical protein K0S99_2318 [Thermomicrobiales bacterium]|nr:hypothetical protein [Thermomicrobiales bacterium]